MIIILNNNNNNNNRDSNPRPSDYKSKAQTNTVLPLFEK